MVADLDQGTVEKTISELEQKLSSATEEIEIARFSSQLELEKAKLTAIMGGV